MEVFNEMVILDITERSYGGYVYGLKTRVYMSIDDLPCKEENEDDLEFWDETDEAWTGWREELRRNLTCMDVVEVEFKVLDRWTNKLQTIFTKEF